jgi:hypothetical protein
LPPWLSPAVGKFPLSRYTLRVDGIIVVHIDPEEKLVAAG